MTGAGSVRIPVEIRAFGDEVGASFTLAFDEGTMRNARVTLGPAVPIGSVLTVNAEKDGRIAILIDSTDPMTASGVHLGLVYIDLELVADSDRISIPVYFTDDLAGRAISDAFGQTLTTAYVGGSVTCEDSGEQTAVDHRVGMWFLVRPRLPMIGTSLSLF